MSPPDDHPTIPPRKVGVLLINLGTPDAPETASVRKYLAEFLSDRRVVELSPFLWKPILHGIVLRTRPRKSAHAYGQVWTEEGSPLAVITRNQARALQQRWGARVMVDWAMRYGSPGIGPAIHKLKDAGCERILVAPLYPQYCAATTATANDLVFATLAGMRWQPAVRTLPPYHDAPDYIDALQATIEAQLASLDFTPERLLLSFHGMPVRTLRKGDPYHCHCQKTSRLLADRLSIPTDTAFQSRFGRDKWLEPATEDVLAAYPKKGVTKIAIAAPGFSADCIETIEELGIRGKETFVDAGGTHFARLDCLNESEPGIAMLDALLSRELAGWVEGA